MTAKTRFGAAFLLLTLTLAPSFAPASEQTSDANPAYDDTALVIACFGSNVTRNCPDAPLRAEMQKRAPGLAVYTGYTATSIASSLKRQGENAPTLQEALASAAASGYKKAAVLSLHVIPGQEYEQVREITGRFSGMPKGLEKSAIGLPLIASFPDARALAKGLASSLPPEREPEDAVIFVGHGTHNPTGGMAYPLLQYCLDQEGRNFFVSTIEGDVRLPDTLAELKKRGIKKAFVSPLLLVVGDHAVNDLFGGDPESWVSTLNANGIKTVPLQRGLAELPLTTEMFADHAQKALDSLK